MFYLFKKNEIFNKFKKNIVIITKIHSKNYQIKKSKLIYSR